MKDLRKYLTQMIKEEDRQAHPGWAVQFEDGSWLCIAHGVHMSLDAFYARTFDTLEDAESTMKYCLQDADIPTGIGFKIIPAWEPVCEVMRHRVRTLTEANKVSPSDIMDMTWQLEDIIATLNKGYPK